MVVLSCTDLHAALAVYTEELGFRLDSIFPADDPAVAMLSGHGLELRLERDRTISATRAGGEGQWVEGRAGMQYRDLIPDRLEASFIASHIRIPEAGPVADYVHFHEVRFQMIYCHRGWVRVVYEDQGPPFVLAPGDFVLQPPEIRHRVLEAGEGTEVIEVSAPAEHVTHVEHAMELPTAMVRRDRIFGGQRFVRHDSASAEWRAGRRAGFETRDTGIGEATGGLAEVRVLRPRGQDARAPWRHEGELLLFFVLRGGATLRREGLAEESLVAGDARAIPARVDHAWTGWTDDVELLEVTFHDPAVPALACPITFSPAAPNASDPHA